MNTSETSEEAELLMFGHIANGDEVVSGTEDRANYVGMGIRVAEVVKGKRIYVAIWIHKVKFSDGEQEHETKGDSIKYGTPEIKGRQYRIIMENGEQKNEFWTKEEANEWLQRKAGI